MAYENTSKARQRVCKSRISFEIIFNDWNTSMIKDTLAAHLK